MAQQQKNFDSTHNWKGDIEGVLRKFAGTKAAKLGLFRRIKVAQGTQGGEVQPDGLGQGGDVFSEINHLDPSPGAG